MLVTLPKCSTGTGGACSLLDKSCCSAAVPFDIGESETAGEMTLRRDFRSSGSFWQRCKTRSSNAPRQAGGLPPIFPERSTGGEQSDPSDQLGSGIDRKCLHSAYMESKPKKPPAGRLA